MGHKHRDKRKELRRTTWDPPTVDKGDSGWQVELLMALVENGLLSNGLLSSLNERDRGHKLVALAIEAL